MFGGLASLAAEDLPRAFPASHFTDRDAVIAAYEAADPAVRDALDSAAETLNTVLVEARDAFLARLATPDAEALAQRAVAWTQATDRARRRHHQRQPRRDRRAATQAAVDALFAR